MGINVGAQQFQVHANPPPAAPPRSRGGLAAAFRAQQAALQPAPIVTAPAVDEPRRFGLHESLLKGTRTKAGMKQAFKDLENHSVNKSKSQAFNGKHHCTNDQVHRIYESMVAKNVLGHPELKKELRPVLRSVFDAMKKRVHSNQNWYETAAQKWHENRDPGYHLGVSQAASLPNKKAELDRGLKTEVGLDFLLFNAKNYDAQGVPPEIKAIRDQVYRDKIFAARGTRTDYQTERNSNQQGFVTARVPQLELKGAQPWQKWGDDKCRIAADSSKYNVNARGKEIPIVCGVSGSTTLLLWSALGSKAKLKESDWRHLLLSTWAGLAADGGHSLQEVLSAARLNAEYLKEHPHLIQKAGLNASAVEAFQKATRGLSATGEDKNAKNFGAYHDAFFSKIKSHGLKEARKKAQQETLEYLQLPDACRP